MEVRKYGKGLQGILLNFNGLLGILYCFCDSRKFQRSYKEFLEDFKVFKGFWRILRNPRSLMYSKEF